MGNFVYNLVIASWSFGGWYLAGLGPALFFLPSHQRRQAFLLAPLAGLCLLTLVGVFQISVLLVPFTPRLNLLVFTLISLLLCWRTKPNVFQVVGNKSLMGFVCFGLPSFILLIFFAWLFYRDGFHLLVGSSDQLQYCLDAKHILEEMHTGSALDRPVPRHDHIVYDIMTRLLPYDRTYRRGAEIMLGSTVSVTGLSYEEAFPVLVLNAFMTLGLAVGFLGRTLFYFSRPACLFLQSIFLSSFYLLLIHVQGSLALILGLAPGLVALRLLSRLVRFVTWKQIALTAVVVAGYFSIYCEPVLVNVILPSILLVVMHLFRTKFKSFAVLWKVLAVYLLAMAFAPSTVYSVGYNAGGNLEVVFIYLHSLMTTATHAVAATSIPFRDMLQQWSLASVVLGAASYYDSSAFNANLSNFVAANPWANILAYMVLCGGGLLGFLKTRNPLARLFAVPLVIWILTSLLMTYRQDGIRFARSLHYAMPFALLGLAILVSRCRWFVARRQTVMWRIATGFGVLLLATFIAVNLYTDMRTVKFLTRHNVSNDPVVLRFDGRSEVWREIKEELSLSALHKTPVLLSGFRDTIHPLAIVSVIEAQPHVLGSSILSFWPLYHYTHNFRWGKLNTRLSPEQFTAFQQQENRFWSKHMEGDMIPHSEQAVVPVGNGYPQEWVAFQDVYAPRIKHIPNICDIIYRKEYALSLPAEKISVLRKDKKGPFRTLSKSSPVIVHDFSEAPRSLVVKYEGRVGDLRLKVGDQFFNGLALKQNGQVMLMAKVLPKEAAHISLMVKKPVKLRLLAWKQAEKN